MKKLGAFMTILGLILTGVYAWHGGFSELVVKEESSGPYYFIYKDHKGAYRETGQLYQELSTYFSEKKVNIIAMTGLYFDVPAVVEDANLRSSIGAIVTEETYNTYVLPEKFKKRIIPAREYIYTDFPFSNYISMFIGIKKAYAVLGEYAKAHNFPEYKYKETGYEGQYSMEIYYADKIRFLMVKGTE